MSKALIITEKPSVARDIVDALGGFQAHGDEFWESDPFVCTFAVGHILELKEPEEIDPIYKRWTLDNLPIIPQNFELKPKSGQQQRIRTIKKLIERPDVDTLINACDAGREGELIFRELVKYLESKKPIRRLWLQSMTHQAIRNGFAHLANGKDYDRLAAAAECRSYADWLIGINASRAMTVRMRSRGQRSEAWSTGRVQTPTLALLVQRELEVLAHVPEPFWRITGEFAAPDHIYTATWFDPEFQENESQPQRKADRLFDEGRAQAIAAAVAGKSGLASETRRPSREAAPPLFDLTSLQREANRRFGWSAARTLSAAQRCYETHKVLTYPRTDSRCLPSDYVGEVERVIDKFAAGSVYAASAQYLIDKGRQNNEKVFNDAGVSDHFAIIPTGQLRTLKGDDERLFDLVVRRFLGAFYPPAVWEQVERRTIVEGRHFSSRARTLRVPGWRAVLDQAADDPDSKGLPPLIPGADRAEDVGVRTEEVHVEADATKPPPRITEARLLSLMENAGKQIEDEDLAAVMHDKGLGTPATRAEIIENLKKKGYVDRTLRPTVKGIRLIDLLNRIKVERLTSAELTGEMEWHLSEIERGKRKPEEYIDEVTQYTREVVDAARQFDFRSIYPDANPVGVCPCDKQRPVYERGWFYRCQEDPAAIEAENDCPFRVWKDKSGRYIDRTTAEILLRDGQTGELEGFADRRGRTYRGVLAIQGKEVVLKPVAGSEQSSEPTEFEVNPEPLCPCPVHADCVVIESPVDYVCQQRKAQHEAGESKPTGVVLPRVVCRRTMSRDEAKKLFETGSTDLIDDFVSRYGKPFSARLKLREDGRHQFEFPNREDGGGRRSARGGRKETASAKQTTKSTGKRTAAKKKSAAKKKKE